MGICPNIMAMEETDEGAGEYTEDLAAQNAGHNPGHRLDPNVAWKERNRYLKWAEKSSVPKILPNQQSATQYVDHGCRLRRFYSPRKYQKEEKSSGKRRKKQIKAFRATS